jgi:hypothetical protein
MQQASLKHFYLPRSLELRRISFPAIEALKLLQLVSHPGTERPHHKRLNISMFRTLCRRTTKQRKEGHAIDTTPPPPRKIPLILRTRSRATEPCPSLPVRPKQNLSSRPKRAQWRDPGLISPPRNSTRFTNHSTLLVPHSTLHLQRFSPANLTPANSSQIPTNFSCVPSSRAAAKTLLFFI